MKPSDLMSEGLTGCGSDDLGSFGSVVGGTHFTHGVGIGHLPIHAADPQKPLKTRIFAQKNASTSDYGSEGCRFNSYWVRH